MGQCAAVHSPGSQALRSFSEWRRRPLQRSTGGTRRWVRSHRAPGLARVSVPALPLPVRDQGGVFGGRRLSWGFARRLRWGCGFSSRGLDRLDDDRPPFQQYGDPAKLRIAHVSSRKGSAGSAGRSSRPSGRRPRRSPRCARPRPTTSSRSPGFRPPRPHGGRRPHGPTSPGWARSWPKTPTCGCPPRFRHAPAGRLEGWIESIVEDIQDVRGI